MTRFDSMRAYAWRIAAWEIDMLHSQVGLWRECDHGGGGVLSFELWTNSNRFLGPLAVPFSINAADFLRM